MSRFFSLLSLLPLFLYLLITEGNLSLSHQVAPAAGNPQGLVTENLFLYGTVYLLALLLFFLPRSGNSRTVLRQNSLPFLLLLIYMLSGLLWTLSPLSVLKETVHFAGIILIGAVAAESSKKQPMLFFSTLFAFALMLVILSIVAALYFPQVGVGINGRWQGVTSHPNHLGITCLVGTFAATSLICLGKNFLWWKIPYFFTLILFFFCLLKADSKTSLLLSLGVVAVIPLCITILRASRISVAVFRISIFYVIAGIIVFLMSVLDPDLLTMDSFFNAIGRSRTLTGRLDLWASGWQAFLERPLLGWGFDNLFTLSTLSPARIQYGQFHNGYLDLLVRGGMIAVLLFLYLWFKLSVNLLKGSKNDREPAIVMFILAAVVLLHNLTETSFMQFPNTLWALIIYIYFAAIPLRRAARCQTPSPGPLSGLQEKECFFSS